MPAEQRRIIPLALVLGTLVLVLLANPAGADEPADPLAWPAISAECRPWTRWWWLGSAVDRENLTRLLKQYREAGLGGVEICPIYGAKGFEDRYLDFLSPPWMEMLAHTTTEAKRLGLGVDLTTGTGWPFGGPTISANEASSRVVFKSYELAGGRGLSDRLPDGKLHCLVAISPDGTRVDLTDRVKDRRLEWTAPAGPWRLYAILQNGPVQKVKRAAPGGAGNVLDPFSVKALDHYLTGFDRAFTGFPAPMPHSHFHDSFEYYGATWTTDFLKEFQQRRGYDLRTQLPALLGDGSADTVARVKCDYRETLSDLHRDYIARWTDWCHGHGSLSRDQAHGAPGNLLDIYAAADIPETEIFGRSLDEKQIPMLKFSSSAAHVSGRKLASSESFTWLGEHFQVSLDQVKPAADLLFLSGVNHLFFHGIPYSPRDVPWPGWLFYAAVNFGPEGGLWHDLPAFNGYVARCQSILQSGQPANDLLLYFPVHDLWQTPAGQTIPFGAPGRFLWDLPFHTVAMLLWNRGYGFDQVSDRLLAGAKVVDGAVQLGGNLYRVIVVPKCRLMPETTLSKLVELARAGATVIVHESLPGDVPGLGDLEKRRAAFQELLRSIQPTGADVRAAPMGKGKVLIGTDLDAMLSRLRIAREPVVDAGVRFIRRTHAEGHHYFLANHGERALDGWVTLGVPVRSAVILDPLQDRQSGVARVRPGGDGQVQVYLQLQPGQSTIVRTFRSREVQGRPWRYQQPAGQPRALSGTWKVQFSEGGPTLPAAFETRELASWTTRDDAEAKRFAGTARYTLEFDHAAGDVYDWQLDLGHVCESARIRLNGRAVAILWCHPFRALVGAYLRPGRNTLEVEVTNLAANRIADLDRRGVPWKNFHEINFVNQNYRPFDASSWPLRDSGLLGPVRLIPVKDLTPPKDHDP